MPQVLVEECVVAGRYAIEARLGDGAMGAVYRARHVRFGRRFAIKVLHATLVQNPKVLRRFEREAELAGRLRHTNVASVVDVGVTDDGLHFMAMELAPGESLTALLAADCPMSEARVLDLARQLCAGLQHAHDLGLIHRDFKPDNVIVEQLPGGREIARIVDWGVAILREDAGDVDTTDRLTTNGIVVGTPHYMAPEQARGDAIDHRVDLFALGLICYELLCGLLPFDGSGVEVARANLSDPIPALAERIPGLRVDPVLEAIVMRLLSKDRDDRPPSANAARELFELYERDRASCALVLGGSLPAGRAHSPSQPEHAPRGLGQPEHASRDPEHDRETEQVVVQEDRRRVALVALAFAAAFALVLWLGLHGGHAPRHQSAIATGGHAPRHQSAIATADAGHDEVALAIAKTPRESDHDATDPPPANERAAADVALASPRAPAKKPQAGSGAGSGSDSAGASKPVAVDAPTAAEVAKLYGVTGRELKALQDQAGMDATIDLWPRYRWIRINEWLATPERRAQVTQLLDRLRGDIRAGHSRSLRRRQSSSRHAGWPTPLDAHDS